MALRVQGIRGLLLPKGFSYNSACIRIFFPKKLKVVHIHVYSALSFFVFPWLPEIHICWMVILAAFTESLPLVITCSSWTYPPILFCCLWLVNSNSSQYPVSMTHFWILFLNSKQGLYLSDILFHILRISSPTCMYKGCSISINAQVTVPLSIPPPSMYHSSFSQYFISIRSQFSPHCLWERSNIENV